MSARMPLDFVQVSFSSGTFLVKTPPRVLLLYILYINLVCRNDAIIMQYIIYGTLWSNIQSIGPVVGVLRCDIARGLYHILGHPPQSYISYIRPSIHIIFEYSCQICLGRTMAQNKRQFRLSRECNVATVWQLK